MQTDKRVTKYRYFQEMDIVDRLKIYMEHIGLQISQFADTALIPRPTLSQILSGRNKKISNEILEKLHTAYPALNISWLLFGDEPMENIGSTITAPSLNYNSSTTNHDAAPAVIDPETNHEPQPQRQIQETTMSASHSDPISLMPDSTKRVQTIMVFYSDNSFETFTPAQR